MIVLLPPKIIYSRNLPAEAGIHTHTHTWVDRDLLLFDYGRYCYFYCVCLWYFEHGWSEYVVGLFLLLNYIGAVFVVTIIIAALFFGI